MADKASRFLEYKHKTSASKLCSRFLKRKDPGEHGTDLGKEGKHEP